MALRGVYAADEDPEYWQTAMRAFPNGVPRFESKREAVEFMERHCQTGSNPEEPQLRQSISTLTTWAQIEKYLLPKFHEYQAKWPAVAVPSEESLAGNRYSAASSSSSQGRPVLDFLTSRLDLPIHRMVTTASAENTLRYLFEHMRCGLLVMIRNNQVVLFCPFVNKDYRNTWDGALEIDSAGGQVESYFAQKEHHSRKENYLQDTSHWWANGNIICNEHCKPGAEHENQWWGDQFLFQLKDMLAETCRTRQVPDCEFFLNKRDYPQIKFNVPQGRAVEPYGFIFNRDDRDPAQDLPLSRHCYKSFAPVLSFYTSGRFADVPFPPSEDWEAATGLVFPPTMNYSMPPGSDRPKVGDPRDLFTAANLAKFERPWQDKVPTAFFRGTATGGGTTVETNQRLHIAQLCWEWDKDPVLGGASGAPYLDAKITGWNMRDKKVASGKMTYVKSNDFPFNGDRAANFVEIYKQSTYKYLVYVEGHCAACRYGFMMRLGSVILKVDSLCVASEMWYFPLLRPFVDHVPVKADLSDLQEKIDWCRQHDDECRAIAANAAALYQEFVSREAILDYMQMVCVETARRYLHPPAWCAAPPGPAVAPLSRGGDQGECPAECTTCGALLEMQKEQQRSVAGRAAVANSQASESNKALSKVRRERMLRKAADAKVKATPTEPDDASPPPPPPPPPLAVKKEQAPTESPESPGGKPPASKRAKH